MGATMLTLATWSCVNDTQKEGQTTDVTAELPSKDVVNAMNDFNLSGEMEVDGRRYEYEFAFDSDPNLPIVTTAEGFRYYDNHVKLIISQGQHVVVERTFTKEAFRELVSARDFQHSVLAGFNRNYMREDRHDAFYFVAVVGDPDESGDISHTIGITIDTHGGIATELIHNVDTDTPPSTDDASADPDEDAA